MRALILCLVLFALNCAHAGPAHVDAHLNQSHLAGQGTFKWFGLKIYDAQLWVGEKGYRPDAPFVLDLVYARKLHGIRIAEASVTEIEKLGLGSPGQRAAWLARMREIFPNVREGTRLSGVHIPGNGVRFYLDGTPLAMVADPAFAQAFFAIWLDPRTSAPALRAALLKDAGAR